MLGQLYARLEFDDDERLTVGRSVYSTPYANRQFNRMTPNTFEGVTLKGSFVGPMQARKFDYLVGYLSKIELRNSDQFIPMSEALGAEDGEGTYLAQVMFSAWGSSIGLAEYFTPQNLNIFYAEATHEPQMRGNYGLKLSAQYTDQREVGRSPFSDAVPLAGNIGLQGVVSYERSVVTLAVSKTSSSGQVLSPWGSNPSYTNAAIKNSNRAGEYAALVRYFYEFEKLGARGLSAFVMYSYAWDAVDSTTGAALQNQRELDLGIKYRVRDGTFKGLSLQIQHNQLWSTGDPDATTQWRVILNWNIPLM